MTCYHTSDCACYDCVFLYLPDIDDNYHIEHEDYETYINVSSIALL